MLILILKYYVLFHYVNACSGNSKERLRAQWKKGCATSLLQLLWPLLFYAKNWCKQIFRFKSVRITRYILEVFLWWSILLKKMQQFNYNYIPILLEIWLFNSGKPWMMRLVFKNYNYGNKMFIWNSNKL